MDVIRLILGIVMLTMGSSLFWMFLGVVGFICGFALAEQLFRNQPHSITIIIAFVAGVAGGLLAVFLQRLAIVAGGFLAGGYLAIGLMEKFGVRTGTYYWLLVVLGGITGAVLMWVLFDWALIILSSGVGATLTLQTLPVSRQMTRLLFIVLIILGIAVQARLFAKKSSHRRYTQS